MPNIKIIPAYDMDLQLQLNGSLLNDYYETRSLAASSNSMGYIEEGRRFFELELIAAANSLFNSHLNTTFNDIAFYKRACLSLNLDCHALLAMTDLPGVARSAMMESAS